MCLEEEEEEEEEYAKRCPSMRKLGNASFRDMGS
jgi:hypothetical protein